jgi:hypothetical protein
VPGTRPILVATYARARIRRSCRPIRRSNSNPGGTFEFQMHYTTNGTATKDRTRVGLFLAKDPSPREVRISQFVNAQLELPAGAADVAVDAEVASRSRRRLWGLFPHTHLRGKKWRHVLVLPDGTKQTILDVSRYDFNWQTYYMFAKPIQIPAGAKIVSTAWYDNSARIRRIRIPR